MNTPAMTHPYQCPRFPTEIIAHCVWWYFRIVLDIRLNPHMHDREIRLDNGWVIKIGRGLDFYQRPNSWFEVGANDLSLRKCLETMIDIFRV